MGKVISIIKKEGQPDQVIVTNNTNKKVIKVPKAPKMRGKI